MPYDAFISYSHAADGKIAPLVHRALGRLAKPWYKARSLSVFRDTTSLAAADDLTASIRAAIAGSRYFVYLASPEAATSRWVGAELAAWRERDLPQRLLIVLTAGEIAWKADGRDFDWAISNALHPNLKSLFHSEPLWVDLRWAKSVPTLSPRDPRFQQAMAMLAAPMHGKSMEAIIGDEVQEQRRTVRWIASVTGVLLLLLFLFVGASVVAFGVNDHLDIANKNLTSKLELVNMTFPFFDVDTVDESDSSSVIDESGANDAAPRSETFANKLTRIWHAFNSKEDSATMAETWVKWGPQRLALASDCEAQKTLYGDDPNLLVDCPSDASLFNPDGLRTDIPGLVNIVDVLTQAQINGKSEMLSRKVDRIAAQFDSGLSEPVEAAEVSDSSGEAAAGPYPTVLDIILPPRLLRVINPRSKAKSFERPFERGRTFQIWRQPLAASGVDAELIFIQLTDLGYCGSGGCDKTVLGFLRLAQRYELIYNATSSGAIALYETGQGNMPQIFAIANHQSGYDQQYVEVRRSVFDQQCLCYTPYLAGRAISFKQHSANQAIPAALTN